MIKCKFSWLIADGLLVFPLPSAYHNACQTKNQTGFNSSVSVRPIHNAILRSKL